MAETVIEYPKFMFGPNGESKIFDRPEDIPEGWSDSPHGPFGVPDVEKPDAEKEKPVSKPVSKGSKKAVNASNDKEEDVSIEDMFEHLKTRGMPELWKMAKDLKIDKSGKKLELIERIVAELQSAQ